MPQKRRWGKSHSLIVLFLFAACSAGASFASPIEMLQEKTSPHKLNRFSVGILAGAGILNSYAGSGPAFGATISYGISKNLAVELAGLFFAGKGENDPLTLPEGTLTIMPLQLSLQGRFPLGRKLGSYLLAGGSCFLNSFSMDSRVEAGWKDVGITLEENVHTAFGFHFGAGLEYALRKTMAVVLDVRYCLGQAKGDWSITDNASAVESAGTFSGLDMNTLIFSIGLKYFFK